jgi:hypothetical protein
LSRTSLANHIRCAPLQVRYLDELGKNLGHSWGDLFDGDGRA